jgi:hypothetical protein
MSSPAFSGHLQEERGAEFAFTLPLSDGAPEDAI